MPASGPRRATQHELTWGHRTLFARLDAMADELRRDRSPRKLAAAVTLYHVVVEGTLAAGLLGQRNGPIGRDPATARILYDLLARNARGEEVPRGTTIQWDFSDCEPWYLQLDGVVKHAVQGRLAKPTVRLRMRFDDFAELISRRAQPASLVARGRMRPWGDPRVLVRMQRLFA